MGPIGMPEMVVIAVIALIIFGPRKLPELGKSLGKSIAEFKRASNELKHTLEDEIRTEELQEARKSAKIPPSFDTGGSRRGAGRRDDAARRCRRVDDRHAGSSLPRSAEPEGLFGPRPV
jgi:TatA/E family protein of Tat protein translocase